MSRRARLLIKSANPDDAAALLNQLPELASNRNIEVQISQGGSQPGQEHVPRVPDEKLETEVHSVAIEAVEAAKGRVKQGIQLEGKPKTLATPTDIAKKRQGILKRLRGWIAAGYGFTIKKVTEGAVDSMKSG